MRQGRRPPGYREPATDPTGQMRRRAIELAVVGVLIAVAAVLRLWRLVDVPPGLHVDEAFNILDAREVLRGWRPVFLPANAGRDVAYTYFQAAIFGVFGESVVSARLASIAIGVATVPAAWGAMRDLLPRPALGRRVALLTTAFLATSYWHLHFSRFGIRAIAFPLVVTLLVWAWIRALAHRTENAGAQAGEDVWRAGPAIIALAVLLGLSAYTHPVGRAVALLPAADAAYRYVRWRDTWPAQVLLAALAGALLVAAPLIYFWFQHPWLFFGHAQEVSVLGAGISPLFANVLRVVAMFNVAGDPAPWRNLAHRPVFDLLTGALFLGGLGLAIRAARKGEEWAGLVLIWLGVLLVPTVATDSAPNFSRAIGVLPVVYVFPALALDRLARELADRLSRHMAMAAVALVLAIGTGITVRDYFTVWADDPDTPRAFDDDKAALALYTARHQELGAWVYSSPAAFEHPTVRVLTDAPPAGFYPAYGVALPPAGVKRALYAYTAWDVEVAAELAWRLADLGVDAQAESVIARGLGEAEHHLTVLEADPNDISLDELGEPTLSTRQSTRFGDFVRFRAVRLPQWIAPGTTLTVTVAWEALSATSEDLNTAVHLLAADDTMIAQGDGPPLGGTYPTNRWRVGEVVVTDHYLDVPAGTPAGSGRLLVGWYDWRSGESLAREAGGTLLQIGETTIAP